ncbi:MAG TPA: HAD-IA family hydrolase [Microlunatus sp.]
MEVLSVVFDLAPAALLLDLDGTLLDSTAAVEAAWLRLAARRGVAEAVVRPLMHGVPARQVLGEILPEVVGPEREELAEEVLADMARADAPVSWLPGARELVDALDGRPWAVVTSGNRLLATSSMRKAGMTRPPVMITSDDVTVGKPDPEPYLRAAALLGVDAADCLVIEDAPAGIAAGRAAGATVLAVEHTYPATELAAATYVEPRLPIIGRDPVTGGLRVSAVGSAP